MDRMFFIVNPVAGSGKCNALFSKCETILRERGIEYIVKKTEYKGHAVKIAEEAIKNGEKFIIAAKFPPSYVKTRMLNSGSFLSEQETIFPE